MDILGRKISKSETPLKLVEKTTFQEWVCLVWKVIPHPVALFCTPPRPPSGHMGPKSKIFGPRGGGDGQRLSDS